MASIPRPRGSHPEAFAFSEDEHTPAGMLRPFLVPRAIAEVLEKDENGRAVLEIITRQATSNNAGQQRIWNAVKGNDKKIDAVAAQVKELLDAAKQNSSSLAELLAQGKLSEERYAREVEARQRGDDDLAEYIGGVLHDLSRNSSADLERDIRVQHVEVISRTALDTASASKVAMPLSAHGKRQVGVLGLVSGFFGMLTAFREPILAYLRLRGWIP